MYVDVRKVEVAKARAWSAIETAAGMVRKREPTLTKEQSVAQALAEQPSLYYDYVRAERAGE